MLTYVLERESASLKNHQMLARIETWTGSLASSLDGGEASRKALDDLISRALAYRTGPELKALFDFMRRFPHIAPYNAMLLHVQNHGIQFSMRVPVWERKYQLRVNSGA